MTTYKKIDPFWIVSAAAWLVYILVYFGRINLSIAIPLLQNSYGYSKTSLGLLASGFFAAYAGGQMINGILGDRFSVRYFVSFGLVTSGICNICFAVIGSFPVMFVCWTLNGYFQSMLWGPLLRVISDSESPQKRHRALSLMSTSPVAGYLLSYILVGKLAVSAGWRAAFIIPGILLLAAGSIWFWRMKGEGQKEGENPHPHAARPPLSFARGSLMDFIIKSRLYLVVVLGILTGIIKEGLSLWSPALFSETLSLDMEKVFFIMSFMPVANFLFVTLSLILNRKNNDEMRIILLFVSASIFFASLLWINGGAVLPVLIPAFYGLMAAVFTVNNLMVTYIPLHFIKDKRVSSAAGIIDSSFYLGAVIAGPVAGAAAARFGWIGIFGGVTCVCVAALITVLFILRHVRRGFPGRPDSPPQAP
jgi:OPA family glycerol-3-phosphate transporter-like MFS transporter